MFLKTFSDAMSTRSEQTQLAMMQANSLMKSTDSYAVFNFINGWEEFELYVIQYDVVIQTFTTFEGFFNYIHLTYCRN